MPFEAPSDDRLTVETPEQTALQFPLAGIGSRFLALAYDTCLQIIAFVLFFLLMALLTFSVDTSGGPDEAGSWAIAIVVLMGFAVYYGYFAFFEAIWNGQTPGKRSFHLRVIKDTGRPIGVYEAIARNLLRIVDQLPGLYLVAIITALLNRNHKRLGDYVAGTVVVHEVLVDSARPVWNLPESSSAPGRSAYDVRQLTVEELDLIETFLQRRASLSDEVRRKMAHQIAQRVADKLDIPREERPSAYTAPSDGRTVGAERFLETLARERRSGLHRS